MADCNSDPTSGCGGDAALIAEITSGTNRILEQLSTVISRLETLNQSQLDCCTEQTGLLDVISGKLTTLISNEAECCSTISGKLDNIITLLTQNHILPSTNYLITFSNHICIQTEGV